MVSQSINQKTKEIKVSDEVWIATALLHLEHPKREDFTVHEILERAVREHLSSELRPGVIVHVYLHCVANREPKPSGYRMLYATGKNTRRLYRPMDPVNPRRKGKTAPRREEMPSDYHYLLDWYEKEYCGGSADPVLALYGLGSHIWQQEHADEYVRRLREGWQ